MIRDLLEYQCSAEGLDVAVKTGLAHFKCRRTDLDVEIMQPASKGFLGLFGRKPALFSLRVIDRVVAGRLVLQHLLELNGFAGEFELEAHDQEGRIVIQSCHSSLLIGRRGQTIDSLETIVNSLLDRVLTGTGRVVIDCEGYRKRQHDAVRQMTLKLVKKVKETGKEIKTEPLPPDQRQIMHHLVKGMPGLVTRSQGQGQLKKMVISTQRR